MSSSNSSRMENGHRHVILKSRVLIESNYLNRGISSGIVAPPMLIHHRRLSANNKGKRWKGSPREYMRRFA